MYNIYDYLKYYKDYDIKDFPWNDMDNLLLSIIVYIPIKSFMGTLNFSDMYKKIISFKIPSKTEFLVPKVKELMEIIKDSNRYKNLKFKNFENILDSNTQFGAMTCKIGKNKMIVFKGTDRSIIGWIENFRLIYQYPTYTQKLAIKYLENNISIFDKSVCVMGHSKGGNLAMCSAMEINNSKFNKIKKIINFDGPGFRKEEFESIKYKKMSKKLVNIIPSSSYIGTLMFNKNYKIIKTSSHAISVHYPIYWNIFGSEFECIDNLSRLSMELHTRTSINIENIDPESVEKYFETAFKAMDYKKTSNISFNFNDIINIFKNVKGIDSKTSNYVNSILKSMIKLSNKSKGE